MDILDKYPILMDMDNKWRVILDIFNILPPLISRLKPGPLLSLAGYIAVMGVIENHSDVKFECSTCSFNQSF